LDNSRLGAACADRRVLFGIDRPASHVG